MDRKKSISTYAKATNGGNKVLINYRVYQLNQREYQMAFAKAAFVTLLVAYLFYASVWGMLLFWVFMPISVKREIRIRKEERTMKLKTEFKETMLMVSAALQVGYSVENAFLEAEKQIFQMLGEKKSVMYEELHQINLQVKNKISLEKAFFDFAKRSGLEEAENFGAVFLFAKRGGGDYGMMLRKAASHIQQKLEMEEEIQTLMAEKKLEMKIMTVMPLGIILYIRLSAGEFLSGLYHCLYGNIIMTVCLLVYGFAIYLAKRIMDIEV